MAVIIGVLGAAGIAPALVVLRPALRRHDVVVAAVASRRGAVEYANRFGIPRAYDSYEELLADPSIDLVYIALPTPVGRSPPWRRASMCCARSRSRATPLKPNR